MAKRGPKKKTEEKPESGHSEDGTVAVAGNTAEAPAEGKKRGRPAGGKAKGSGGASGPAKKPANPFADKLPNYDRMGSPSSGNWRPTGDPVTDYAALEGQEREQRKFVNAALAKRMAAKAVAFAAETEAQEYSVIDGGDVHQAIRFHRVAQDASRKLDKATEDYKEAREGLKLIGVMKRRYATDPELPLLEKSRKAG